MSPETPGRLELVSWPWPEVSAGDDLATLICTGPDLTDGDVVVITSKVVSKAEGRAVEAARVDLAARDTVRVVARRGSTEIAQTAHGLVLAGAGVDASNVTPGQALSLPTDPDGTARRLRESVLSRRGLNVAVVITDTAGRAWRIGQIDIAIGCAGLPPAIRLAGTTDGYGNVLAVTESVIVDEVASAADLVKGKSSGRPMAVLRGLGGSVLAPGQHGPGAEAIVRASSADLFGLGARDAVIAAAYRDTGAPVGFPAMSADDRAPFEGLSTAHAQVHLSVDELHDPASEEVSWTCQLSVRADAEDDAWIEVGRLTERMEALAWGHGLRGVPMESEVTSDTVWRAVSGTHWIVA